MEGWKGWKDGRMEGRIGRMEGWNTLLRWKWRVTCRREGVRTLLLDRPGVETGSEGFQDIQKEWIPASAGR